jgi:hypothetical protein
MRRCARGARAAHQLVVIDADHWVRERSILRTSASAIPRTSSSRPANFSSASRWPAAGVVQRSALDRGNSALSRQPEGMFLSPLQGEIGPDLFRESCEFGLEGLVSKHRDVADSLKVLDFKRPIREADTLVPRTHKRIN